jgi:hypothetical protein
LGSSHVAAATIDGVDGRISLSRPFRQFEVSDTRVFDRPAAGRSFFEQLIRDHLDVGRPESVS